MKATIITVGDEILIGQIENTNAGWLGVQLSLVGLEVERMETVADRIEDIRYAIRRGFETSELVVVTGGLGPTHDDVTREAVAQSVDCDLHYDERVMEQIRKKFELRGRRLPPSNERLAYVPGGFEVLSNTKGTAPGLWGTQGNQHIIVLPGVPYEMKAIMREHVLPRLDQMSDGVVIHKTLLTVGQGESMLAESLGDLSDVLINGVTLAYLPGAGIVRLRVTSRGKSSAEAQESLDSALAHIRKKLGDRVFGEGADKLEAVVGEMLKERNLTIATAESCTGGAVAHALTRIPGSSQYFLGGVVAYDNDVKVQQLGVRTEDLEAYGAVSEIVVRQMAAGVRTALNADIGVATAGIAGPTGGSKEKPVGTVWLGFASASDTYAVRLQLTGDRTINIRLSMVAALNLVRRQLLRRVVS